MYKKETAKTDLETEYRKSDKNYTFLNILIISFYIIGFIIIATGTFFLILGIGSASNENTINGTSISIINSSALIITGLLQIGFAELLKILIRIERNTRKI